MTTVKAADGLELNAYVWMPNEPRIGVALFHGYGEHAGRYAHVAEAWNQRGIAVLAADLRGHGKSPGRRGYVERFAEYHRDADAMLAAVQERVKGAPVVVFGHSMGALVALHWWLARRPAALRGMALTSPFLGLAVNVPGVKAAAGRVMSRLLPTFAMDAGLKGADVTRDPELGALYDRDPLNNKKATARWFTESQGAIDSVHARVSEIDLPMLLMYGAADRVASAEANARFGAGLKGPEQTVERVEGGYHELVNEPKEVRDPVIARLGDWILARGGTEEG